jgi:TorA maturation chaperone TorD
MNAPEAEFYNQRRLLESKFSANKSLFANGYLADWLCLFLSLVSIHKSKNFYLSCGDAA